MFKAVLLSQWHSLITHIDFNLFCRFDELSIPDYSTLCRYRNRLAQDDTLAELPGLINRQLIENGLKVGKHPPLTPMSANICRLCWKA